MPLKPLEALAWNYWWSWAPDGAALFRDLDPELWEECEHNPRKLLAKLSAYRLAEVASDPVYLERVDRIGRSFDAYMASKAGGDSSITPEHPVAYFCAEFGVHNSLPLYSGGLGILAGDHLKSASDLNLPLVAVGLFYGFGYFQQSVTTDDWQAETYKETYPDELPVEPVIDATDATGAPLMIDVTLRGRVVRARTWRA